MSTQVITLTLIGKADCHLCDEAKAVIGRVLEAAANSQIPVELREVSIFEDDSLAEKYGEDIPVVLVNGNAYASLRVYEDKLAYAILHERDRAQAKARRWWRRGR